MASSLLPRLLLALSPIIPLILPTAAIAQTTAVQTSTAISCKAIIPLTQDSRLTYRLSGPIADRSDSSAKNPIGNNLVLTVTKTNQQGQVQTLLNNAPVEAYEQIAPDADYSKLPFTGTFRGQPNDGFRLYSVRGSAHGLYVSLRPIDGQPQQLQIVHYLSSGKFVRTIGSACSSR